LIWENGNPLQGITGAHNGDRHIDFPLGSDSKRRIFWIECAANGMFGAGEGGNGSIHPPVPDRQYTLETAKIVEVNELAHSLLYDFQILISMAKKLPESEQTAHQALYVANSMVNAIHAGKNETLIVAKDIARKFFDGQFIAPHQVFACGNCHIDTAWLWPYDETKRKVARSWATQCGLIETYPNYIFAASVFDSHAASTAV
jgi:alpha-mannosidase